MDITIEMNLDQLVVARAGYTILDLISDIGGMQGMLISAAAFFLTIWNHNHMENFLVTRLYRLGSTSVSDDEERSEKRSKILKRSSLTNPIDYICDKLP